MKSEVPEFTKQRPPKHMKESNQCETGRRGVKNLESYWNYTINRIKKLEKKHIVLVLVFLLTPVLAGIVISLVSSTSLLQYDAYNTKWNDETSYNITIREIREFGTPQNVRSYNEVEPKRLGYGVYRVTTYIPYLVASFFTGISSHNYFVYCNLFLVTIANIFFIWAVQPEPKRLIWLIAFNIINIPVYRYIWSGMAEGSHISMAIVMTACGLFLLLGNRGTNRQGNEDTKKGIRGRGKERTIFAVSVILPLFYGTIRGYQFIYILIPLAYLIIYQQGIKRYIGVAGIFLLLCISVYLYVAVLPQWISPYFQSETVGSTGQFKIYLNDIRAGNIGKIIADIIKKNESAFKTVSTWISSKSWHWVIIVEPLAMIVLLVIYATIEKKRSIWIFTGSYVAVSGSPLLSWYLVGLYICPNRKCRRTKK